MIFSDLLARFTAAVETGDGTELGKLFTLDGVYHDTFYGEFQGPAAIKNMLENHFWRDAEAFRWDMNEPVATSDLGYANWLFSYASKLDGAKGKRILFKGMSRFQLREGLIQRYDEVFDIGIALTQTHFAPERLARILAKAAETLRAGSVGTHHLSE